MQSKELRIGNLVKNNEPRYGDKILVIESIGDNDTVNIYFRKYPMSALEPLPLIEEYLMNFGFEKSKTYEYDELFIKGNFSVQLPKKGYDNSVLWYGEQILSELKYIHQLQNLYFALTGEELDFNEKSKP